MRVDHTLRLVLPAMLALAGCESSPPPTTQIVVQQPAMTIVPSAPTPPPPPMSEVVPPPPASSSQTIWQPGHWSYTGISSNPWNWETVSVR